MENYKLYINQIMNNKPDLTIRFPKPQTVNQGYYNNRSGKGKGRAKCKNVEAWIKEANHIISQMPFSERSILSECKTIGIIHSMKFAKDIKRDCANFEKFTTDTLVNNGIIPDDRYIRINIQQFEDWAGKPDLGYVNVHLYKLTGG